MTAKSTLRRIVRDLALRVPPVRRLYRDRQRLEAECALLQGELYGLKATLAALQASYAQARGGEIAGTQASPQVMGSQAIDAPGR
jgi:hypothetical protein